MMTPDHFFQISEDVGTSGQPTEDLFVDIAAAGYETVINLTKVKAMDAQQASSPILRKWAPDMEGAWRKFMGITSEELGL